MNAAEIKQLTTQEILDKIDDERNLLVRQKLNHAVSPLENPLKIKETRRFIARLKTILRERDLADK